MGLGKEVQHLSKPLSSLLAITPVALCILGLILYFFGDPKRGKSVSNVMDDKLANGQVLHSNGSKLSSIVPPKFNPMMWVRSETWGDL